MTLAVKAALNQNTTNQPTAILLTLYHMTKIWPSPIPTKIRVAQMFKFVLDLLEILWENEKMLVISIFTFSRSVFKCLLLQGHEKL